MSALEWKDDIDVAARQQVQVAFSVLIQNLTKNDPNALERFIRYVRLVDATREAAVKALVGRPLELPKP